jgi:hypothetical protein
MACKGSGVQIPSAPPQVRRPLHRRPPANRPPRAANRQQSPLRGRSSVRHGGAAGQHRWRRRPADRAHPGRGRRPSTARSIDHRPASRPHLYQGSARGLVSAGSHLPPARTMYRWRPLRTARIRWDVDQTWTKAWLASRLPIPSGRRMPPALWSWRPGSRSAGRYSRADHLANGTTRALTRVAEKVALTRSR